METNNLKIQPSLMNIFVLCDGYPSKKNYGGIFVSQLCDKFADMGNNVSIIAPQSLTNLLVRGNGMSACRFTHTTKGGNEVEVYRPYYVSFSNINFLRKIGNISCHRAIASIIKKIGVKQDIFYGHFWHNAYMLYNLINKSGKPLFVATGESTISFHMFLPEKRKSAFCNYIKGVICVSTKNKEESIKKGLTTAEKCIVIPNAVDETIFYLKNKNQCRQKLGFPLDCLIIAYIGSFTISKGVLRLSNAIELLNDSLIKSIFIGQGKHVPNCEGILYSGFLDHDEIANYLNSADIFVLPTLAEGSSNAIVEALACGIPIISSNCTFNYDTLNEYNSILINPSNIDEISNAIKTLKDNLALRIRLSNGAKESAKELTLSSRAKKIINYINLNCRQDF